MSKKIVITVLVGLLLIGVAYSYSLKKRKQSSADVINNKQVMNPEQKDTQQVINDENLIQDNWNTYQNNAYKLSFRYPDSWEVKSIPSSDMGGTWFSIAPKDPIDNGKLRFELSIFKLGQPFKSENNPESWFKNNIEDPDRNPYYTELKKLKINGNPVYYTKTVKASSTDNSYIFSNGKLFFMVTFREKEIIHDNAGNIQKEWDYSKYLTVFEFFVNSINL